MNLLLKNRLITTLLLSMMFLTNMVSAQEEDVHQKNEISEQRMLGGHYFTPSNNIKIPFFLTSIRTSLGVGGVRDLRFPLVDVGGQEYFYLQGDIFAAILIFEYQHVVKDWLAVFTKMGLTARLGSSIATLATQGINYATTFDIGWMVKVIKNENFALAGTFEVTNGNYNIIDIRQFIQDIIAENENAAIIFSNNSLFGKVGLKAAYGINKFIGINAFLDLGFGETIQRNSENKFFTATGINADLNFHGLIKAPISLSLGYLHNSYPRGENKAEYSTNIIAAQLNYIGRSDFVLSLDLLFSRELSNLVNQVIWLNSAMFSMRYLF